MSDATFNRTLGLADVTFIAIGFTIGAGVFVFTGIAAKMAGPALPLAYALAVVPVFLCMLPIAMLGAALPSTGGNYRYPSRMVSPQLAFVGVWVYVLCSFFGQVPLYAMSCGHYAREIFPDMEVTPFAVGLLTFFYVINLFGLRLATVAQAIMVLILIGALLFYASSGLIQLEPSRFTDFFQKGRGGLLTAVALLTFTYFGANGIIELGGEIRRPGKVIPRALFITFPVVLGIYLMVSVATVGTVPLELLIDAEVPLIAASRTLLSQPMFTFFIVGGAIVALTSTLNALLIVGTRSLLMMAEDGLLPRFLTTQSERFGSHFVMLTAFWLMSVLGVLSGLSLETFASYAALGSTLILCPVLIAAKRLPRMYPTAYARSEFKLGGIPLWLCTSAGLALALFFCAVILIDLKSPAKIAPFFLILLSGIGAYRWRRRQLRKQGVDLEALCRSTDWGRGEGGLKSVNN